MSDLFSGLEGLGLKKVKNVEVYKSEEKEEEKQQFEKEGLKESDFLFLKTYTCPVCEKEVKTATVKTGTVKLERVDTDLRPKYVQLDSIKYGVTLCDHCGYAALGQYFMRITSTQKQFILDQISPSFEKPVVGDSMKLSYDEAILRHKLALLNAVVKEGRNSERAYTCLRTAWLYRGKAEEISEGLEEHLDKDSAIEAIAELEKEEEKFLVNAYEGFHKAYFNENFPISGMDINTVSYILGDLARRIGKYDEAGKWISQVLVARDASKRLKDRARNIKDLLVEEKKND